MVSTHSSIITPPPQQSSFLDRLQNIDSKSLAIGVGVAAAVGATAYYLCSPKTSPKQQKPVNLLEQKHT